MFSINTRSDRPSRFRAVALLAVAGLVITGCSGINNAAPDAGGNAEGGESVTWTLVTGAQADTPNAAVEKWFLDRVEEVTDGRINFERTATESLCKAPEVADCVRDGRAQIGVTVPDYTPQYFPSTSMVSIPFLSQNAQAAMQSIYDLHNDYEPAKAIMDRNGLHHVATWPVGRFLLGGHEPVTSIAQFQGAQVRVSGPIIQKAIGNEGANIVAVTAHETYEAVERGVVSTIGGAIDFPVNYGLMELLPNWTDPGIGQYSTFGMWVNKEAYEALPEDLREMFDQVTEELNTGAGIKAFNNVATGQCQLMQGAATVESLEAWSEADTKAWESKLGDSAKDMWIELATEQGLDDAAGVLEGYISGLESYADAAYDDATVACVESFESR